MPPSDADRPTLAQRVPIPTGRAPLPKHGRGRVIMAAAEAT